MNPFNSCAFPQKSHSQREQQAVLKQERPVPTSGEEVEQPRVGHIAAETRCRRCQVLACWRHWLGCENIRQYI